MAQKKKDSESIDRWIYDGIDLERRIIYIQGDIDTENIGKYIRAVMLFEKLDPNAPISVLINSNGGIVQDGMALYDRLVRSSCPVHSHATGSLESMAFILFLAGDTRTSEKHTLFMNHGGQSIADGDLENMKTALKVMELQESWCNDILVEKSNKPLKFWEKQSKHPDKYYTADEALEMGIVTQILGE